MATLAPMPIARMTIAVAAKPGFRRSWRIANPRSWTTVSVRKPTTSRLRSLSRSELPNCRFAARRASFALTTLAAQILLGLGAMKGHFLV